MIITKINNNQIILNFIALKSINVFTTSPKLFLIKLMYLLAF